MPNEPGYVYLLINHAMPGLVKVGRTGRSPADRLTELSGATGVPTPFELVYDVLVPDAAAAEQFLHTTLTEQGYRLADNREFFRAPIREVVRLMIHVRESMESSTLAARGKATATEHGAQQADGASPDPLFREAAIVCIENQAGSTPLLQRRLGIGYGRAAMLIDKLRDSGILTRTGGPDGYPVIVSRQDLDRALPE